jgi:hypothetical protein
MDDITVKSIGMLIDELITTSLKCWYAQEDIMNDKNVADAAKKAQKHNARRNALIQAIDKRLGDGDISPTNKTYA